LRDLLNYDPARAAETRSELERLFLDLIRDARLPVPQVNVLVEGFEVDAYWPEARLVVELQGYAHHSDRETFERDHLKLAHLKLAGFEFLPLTYRQVAQDRRRTATTILRLLERAGPGANL
jgi:very-short-patch-repair endonuclease